MTFVISRNKRQRERDKAENKTYIGETDKRDKETDRARDKRDRQTQREREPESKTDR